MRSFGRLGAVAVACAAAVLAVAMGGQADRSPSLEWSPTTNGSFDFGLVGVGKTASQTFTLTNSGGSASAALTVELSGPAALTITDDTCTATSLGPRKSCTVTVEYAPTASGASGVATLDANGVKADASASARLSGSAALEFVTSLSPLNENPPHPQSSATGSATVFWDTSTSMMTVHVEFSGLTTPNTAAHIHCCVASPGNAGVATTVPTFTGFPGGTQSGTYTHTFDMLNPTSYNPAFLVAQGGSVTTAAAALLAGLEARQAYLNVHTTMFGGGEMRGFLQLDP